MSKILYFDAFSGASGDMVVGALLGAGAGSIDGLREALRGLPVGGYSVDFRPVDVGSIRAGHFSVEVDEASQKARDWAAIRSMLEAARGGALSAPVAGRALEIFARLAEAEARVHGTTVDHVHFHEVGAVDSIIDIVAAAWCLEALAVDECYCGPLPGGSGFVETSHGRLPVPAPATAELLRGLEVLVGDGEGELVTPTGAAILATVAIPMRPGLLLRRVGLGAGTRRLSDRPNLLRVLVGEGESTADREIVEILADIDDMTPEQMAHAADRIRAVGALDVAVSPTVMKRGRLGMSVRVLGEVASARVLAEALLRETSTIGVRYRAMRRDVLPRRAGVVSTVYGDLAVKIVEASDGRERVTVEFADAARVADAAGVAITEVYAAVEAADPAA